MGEVCSQGKAVAYQLMRYDFCLSYLPKVVRQEIRYFLIGRVGEQERFAVEGCAGCKVACRYGLSEAEI